MRISTLLFLLFGSSFLFAQYPFEPLTTEVGIDNMINGLTPNNLRDLGTGVSVVDIDGDGLEDIVMTTGIDYPILFYLNNGDETFTEVPSPVVNNSMQKGIVFGDIDNDGDMDFFVAGDGAFNELYRNDGNLVFTKITQQAGLIRRNDKTFGASFCDVNADGLLDLYVCNREKATYGNFLYINQGNNTFTEEAQARGVADDTQLSHQSLFFDYDNDGDQDLYVINDRLYLNSLFQNDGSGYFTDVSAVSGTNIQIDAMNASAGDIDNNGYLEIFITNNGAGGGGDRLLYNNGDGTFTDMSTDMGAAIPYFTWSGIWLDYDNDTDQDLYVASMKVQDPNVLLTNFLREISIPIFLNSYPDGHPEGYVATFCAAYFDFNDDGKLDIVTPNAGPDSPIQLWKNIDPNTNNWVKFKLEGVYSTRDAVGTRVEIFLDGQKYTRYLTQGEAYLSQNHKKIHFGLYDAIKVDSVIVHWLSGITDKYYDLNPNMTHSFVENASNTLELDYTATAPSCFGFEDGDITVNPLTGTAPYTAIWDNGETGLNISNLPAGRYLVTVTDDLGETGVSIVDLQDPAVMDSEIFSQNNSGTGDGMVEVMPNGGSGIYSYSWDNGATTPDITNLDGGVYEVEVSDDKGCLINDYGVVYNENDPCAAFVPTSIETTVNSARLSWATVPNATIYRLVYRELGESNWISIPNTSETFLLIPDLEAGLTYEYKTKSKCTGGFVSEWSDIREFALPAEGFLCESWVADIIFVDNNTAIINFPDVSGADNYRIRFREVGTIPWERRITPYSLFTLEPIAIGTEFEYQTSSRCPNGWTPWSEEAYFETEGSLFGEEGALRALPNEANKPAFVVYPNPARTEVEVLLNTDAAQELILRDVSGRVHLSETGLGQAETIDISRYPAGIYFLSVIFEDGSHQNERLIIQR
ncbi:MAG: T9SS type A sorting domain-containing protein [Bacteroidetes bacterium]|nr:T9SS type A sorting domain-containing protein [Bacteroidota bacterium]